MGYWSKAKKKVYRRARHRARMVSNPVYAGKYRYKKYKKAYRYGSRLNDKHDVIGLSPNNWISPIDFVPYVNVANKGRRVYKTTKKTRKYRKRVVRGVKSGYRTASRVKSRNGRSSSSPNRTKRRSRPYVRGRRYEYYRRKK